MLRKPDDVLTFATEEEAIQAVREAWLDWQKSREREGWQERHPNVKVARTEAGHPIPVAWTRDGAIRFYVLKGWIGPVVEEETERRITWPAPKK